MKSTLEYLDDAKRALEIESDYALAKWLGVKHAAISNYRSGRSRMDDYVAARIAEALQIDPLEVIAAANFEREKEGPKKAFWESFSRPGVAPMCIFFVVLSVDWGNLRKLLHFTRYTLCAIREEFSHEGRIFLVVVVGNFQGTIYLVTVIGGSAGSVIPFTLDESDDEDDEEKTPPVQFLETAPRLGA